MSEGSFDVILFSASLHHFPNIEETVRIARKYCRSGGILIAYEPSRKIWDKKDAAILAFARCLLSITGNWYNTELSNLARTEAGFQQVIHDTLVESTENRDELTPDGQSDQDDILSGPRIYQALKQQGELLLCEPAFAYLHNGLGGLRADNHETLFRLADFLALFERFALKNEIISQNSEFFVARCL